MTLRAARARWRVAARLARRQTRRSLGTSVLIAALIAMPVAGLVGTAAVFTSTIPTDDQLVDSLLGQTQTRLDIVSGPDPSLRQSPAQADWWEIDRDQGTGDPVHTAQEALADPTAALPQGTTVLRVDTATLAARTTAGVTTLPAIVGPAGDPAFAGRYDVVAGRAASGPDEAMATASALDRLGVDLGDELVLVEPRRVLRITGLIDVVDQADATPSVAVPSTAVRPEEISGSTFWYLPERALSWSEIQELNAQGIVALSRDVALDPPVTGTYLDQPLVNVWSTLGAILIIGGIAAAFVAYQVVLLAGAAFAVGARRQQRALATVASVGATARDLRRIVVLQGLVLGTLGALIGTGLGIAGAALTVRLLDDGNRTTFWSFVVNPWITTAIVVFAVVVGVASALLPARAAGRTNVLQALRGARRPQIPRTSRPVWGSILALVGIGITVACTVTLLAVHAAPGLPFDSPLRWTPQIGLFVGPILAQVGVILAGHWLLAVLSRPLSRLGLSARLASRDAAANASRSVPALASTAAAVLLAVFAVAMVGTNVAAQARSHHYPAPMGSLAVQVFGEERSLDTAAATALEAVAVTDPAASGVLWAGTDYWALVESDRGDAVVPIAILAEDRLCPSPVETESDTETPTIVATGGTDCAPANADPTRTLFAADAADLAVLLGSDPSSAALRTFDAGGAIVTDPAFDHGGEVKISTWRASDLVEGLYPPIFADDELTGEGERALPAVLQETARPLPYPVIVSRETGEELGIAPHVSLIVAQYKGGASAIDAESVNARVTGLDGAGFFAIPVDGPPSPALAIVLILGATGVLMLGTSVVALGLARIDGRADDATLAAVGAPRGLRRRISFWQGLLIIGLGALSGTFAGLLPAGAIIAQSSSSLRPEDIPWWPIAGIALGLPLLVALVNGLTSRRTPVLARRTPID